MFTPRRDEADLPRSGPMNVLVQSVKILAPQATHSATEAAATVKTEIKVQTGDGPKMANGTQENGANEKFLCSKLDIPAFYVKGEPVGPQQHKAPRKGKLTLTPITYVGAPLHAVGQPRHGLCPQGS